MFLYQVSIKYESNTVLLGIYESTDKLTHDLTKFGARWHTEHMEVYEKKAYKITGHWEATYTFCQKLVELGLVPVGFNIGLLINRNITIIQIKSNELRILEFLRSR